MMHKYGEELEEIRKRAGGVLHTHDVVTYAQDESTELHKLFEWNDTEAARLHRLFQARNIIRACVTVIEKDGKPITVSMYTSQKTDRYQGGGYRATVEILSDDDRREALLAEALAEFIVFQAKYSHLKELAPLFEVGNGILGKP